MDNLFNMVAQIATGSQVTLSLFAVTLILAIPLGLILALMRLSRWRLLTRAIGAYVWLMRGTPLMLQMLFIYFGLPVLFKGLTIPAFPAAAIAFALNYAAYFSEIFRGGIEAVGKGQYEAAKALGLTYPQTMRRIVLPQMVKRILAPFGNEVITLVKDTSLVYVLAIYDLLRVAATIVNREFTIVPFLVAAAFYLAMTLVLTLAFQRLEKRYAVYDD